MGVDAIYKIKDDGIPYKELNQDLADKISKNQSKG